jgi:hypothetical protein
MGKLTFDENWDANELATAHFKFVEQFGDKPRNAPLWQYHAWEEVGALKEQLDAGNLGVLLRGVYLCFHHDLPIPDWITKEFNKRFRQGQEGKIKSWDEAFGRPARWGTGSKQWREHVDAYRVNKEVQRLKAEGQPLNEEQFEAIGRTLGVGGKTKVKSLYSHFNKLFNRKNP